MDRRLQLNNSSLRSLGDHRIGSDPSWAAFFLVLVLAVWTPTWGGWIRTTSWGYAQDRPKVRCTGEVVDPNGRPLAGATVSLYQNRTESRTSVAARRVQEVVTGADGTFVFEQEAVQGYAKRSTKGMLLASKEGLACAWADWGLDVDLKATLRLGSPMNLAGQVVEPTGGPVEGVAVRIVMMEASAVSAQPKVLGAVSDELFTCRTGRDGRFRFEGLPAYARAELAAEKSGWSVRSGFDPSPQVPLVFSAGQGDARIVLHCQAAIEGTVIEQATGLGKAGVTLSVKPVEDPRPWESSDVQKVTSGQDGSFQIQGLWPGRYAVAVVALGQGMSEWMGKPIEAVIEPGQSRSQVRMEVSRGGVLEVRITDSQTQSPLDDVSIAIREVANHADSMQEIKTQQGLAKICLMPGSYVIQGIWKQGYPQCQPDRSIQIDDNQTVHEEFELGWEHAIQGRAIDASGRPVEGVQIEALGVQGQAVTNGQGRFRLNWQPSDARDQTTLTILARHEGLNLAALQEVEAETREMDLRLEPGMAFYCEVTDAQGNRIKQPVVSVLLRYISNHSRMQSMTASDLLISAEINMGPICRFSRVRRGYR